MIAVITFMRASIARPKACIRELAAPEEAAAYKLLEAGAETCSPAPPRPNPA